MSNQKLVRDNEKPKKAADKKPDWGKIFEALDCAGVPDDFLADRDTDPPQSRP